MQIIERLSTVLKAKDLSVLKFSNESGISAYKVYKWLDGKGNPKVEDSKKIEEWLRAVDKVPRDLKIVSRQEPDPAMRYTSPINTSDRGTTIIPPSDKDQQIADLRQEIKWLRERLAEAESSNKDLRAMLANSMQKS